MANRGGPANNPGLLARIVTRFGRHQTNINDRRPRRRNPTAVTPAPQVDSIDSEDDDEDVNEEDEVYMGVEGGDSYGRFHYRSMPSSAGRRSSDGLENNLVPLDHVIAHSTAIQNSPSEGSARLGKAKKGATVNTLSMLAGREFNVSGNGKFSRAECCHVASRYLPTDGPSIVEQLDSRAYIGQFSKDGSLFVAGFQVHTHTHTYTHTHLSCFLKKLEV